MNNPTFIDEENIPLVNQDEDYDEDYRTPETSWIDDASFTLPDTTEATSTLRLRQELKKKNRINALYRHLNVTGNLGLAKLDTFMIKENL